MSQAGTTKSLGVAGAGLCWAGVWGLGCILGLLYSFLPPRSHLAEAAALYSLMDEQLHILVTTSNHLLGRLELRVRLGRLEAAIHQVKGEPGLGDVGDSAWQPTYSRPGQAFVLV